MKANLSSSIRTRPILPTRHQIDYSGKVGRTYLIYLKKWLLGILTLGIYHFWGKTNVRKYLWNRTDVMGDSLEYTGTGKEKFISFIFAILLVFIPIFALHLGGILGIDSLFNDVLKGPGEENLSVFALLSMVRFGFFIFIFSLYNFIFGAAVFASRRYVLSRTTWKGTRFAQAGSTFGYALRNLFWSLLNGITLGLLTPIKDISLAQYRINQTYFGSKKFEFHGSAEDLYPSYIGCWFLFIFTFGISMYFYNAKKIRYIAEMTNYENLKFENEVEGLDWFFFNLVNGLLLVFTSGIAFPYVLHRFFEFFSKSIHIEGNLNFSDVEKTEEERPKYGEGIFEAFDFGIGSHLVLPISF